MQAFMVLGWSAWGLALAGEVVHFITKTVSRARGRRNAVYSDADLSNISRDQISVLLRGSRVEIHGEVVCNSQRLFALTASGIVLLLLTAI